MLIINCVKNPVIIACLLTDKDLLCVIEFIKHSRLKANKLEENIHLERRFPHVFF